MQNNDTSQEEKKSAMQTEAAPDVNPQWYAQALENIKSLSDRNQNNSYVLELSMI